MDKLTDPSVEEETKIEDIAGNLYARIAEETEKILESQLKILGVDIGDHEAVLNKGRKFFYSDDPLALASYEYDGIRILGVRISENRMAIVFDVPELKAQRG